MIQFKSKRSWDSG